MNSHSSLKVKLNNWNLSIKSFHYWVKGYLLIMKDWIKKLETKWISFSLRRFKISPEFDYSYF